MDFLASLDENTLDRLQKFSAQMSTAMRTFSKLIVSLKKIGTKSSDYALDHDSYSDTEPETLVDWIFSKRCGWKQTHGKDVALWFLGGKYRADRCGNTWFRVGDNVEARSSWQKVPNSQIMTLYETYGDMFDESRELVENAKPSWMKRIRPGKRLRKENIILATQIDMKEFVEIMKERHKALPPLRRIT